LLWLVPGKGTAEGIADFASDLFQSIARQATFFGCILQTFAGLCTGFFQLVSGAFRGVHQSFSRWPERSLLNFCRGKCGGYSRPSGKTNKRDRQRLLLKNLLRGRLQRRLGVLSKAS
jgi:hypothetical protein